MANYDIIIKPVLSEKSYADIANKKYTFKVAKSANKTQIKQAIEEIFKVKVASVNTSNVYGKIKKQGRFEGLTGGYKRAVVQLTADSKSIEFFDSLS